MHFKTEIWLSTFIAAAILFGGCTKPAQDITNSASQSEQIKQAAKGMPPLTAEQQAKQDLGNGIWKLKYPPLPNPPWWNQYTTLLMDQCKVDIEIVYDFQEPRVRDAMVAYNKVVEDAVRQEFGDDIFDKLDRQAKKKAGVK